MSTEPLTAAYNAVDQFVGQANDPATQLVVAKIRGLMAGYHLRWKDAGYRALSVEKVYTSPLWNPNTERPSRTFTLAGKLDVYVEDHERRRFVIDHKTLSENITEPDSPLFKQLAIENQVNHYLLLQHLNGERPDGAIWDCIRKPTIGPKKLTKAERASAVAERKYFGRILDMDTLAGLQTDERETVDMYEARLAHDCTTERPEFYFHRRAVPRMDHEIAHYAEDLWEISKEILESQKRERLPKTSASCMQFGSACRYLGVCSGYDTIDSPNWKRKEHQHRELGEGVGNALTSSRIKCFQACKVRHRYDYELQVERVNEEDKDSLYFGSLMHLALESWWRCFLIPTDENTNAENTHGYSNSTPATVASETSDEQW